MGVEELSDLPVRIVDYARSPGSKKKQLVAAPILARSRDKQSQNVVYTLDRFSWARLPAPLA